MARDTELATSLAACFRSFVVDQYVPRIRRCVELLTPEEVWLKLGPHSNAVGNLLVHLTGNVRQWILCGLGDQPDHRDRDAEFAATGEVTGAAPIELVDRLEATVREAADIVDGLGPAGLLAPRTFQGRYEETGLYGVVHVIEHFSGHAGQIYAFTKQQKQIDLKFYDL